MQAAHFMQFGLRYYNQCKYEDAIRCWNTCLEIYQVKCDWNIVVACFLYIGDCYSKLEKHYEAVQNFEQCLQIIACHKIDKELLGSIYLETGNAIYNTCKPVRSRQYFEKALEIAKEIKNHEQQCKCYIGLCNVFGNQEQFKTALIHGEHALRIAQEHNLKKEKFVAIHVLGNAYLRLGRVLEAIDAFSKCLESSKQCGDINTEGFLLDNLSKCYLHIRDYDKAIHYARESVLIAERNGSLRLKCLAYRNIGIALREKGEINDAMQYHKEELGFAREAKDEEQVAIALGSLGNICLIQYQFSEAILYFEECKKLCSDLGHEVSKGGMHNNLGLIYRQTGKLHEAASDFEKCLSISENAGDTVLQVTALQNLKEIYAELNKLELSREYELKHIVIAIQTNDKMGEIMYLQSLAKSFSQNRDFEQELKFLRKALCLSIKIDNSQMIGIAYMLIAENYLMRERRFEAIEYFEIALKIYTDSGSRLNKANCLSKIGAICSHNVKKTEQCLRESMLTYEEIFDDLKDMHDLKISIIDRYVASFKMLALHLIEQNQASEALLICDRGRGRALADILAFKYDIQKQRSQRTSLSENDLVNLLNVNSCVLYYSFLLHCAFFWILTQEQPLMFVKNEMKENSTKEYMCEVIETAYHSLGVRQMTANTCEDRSFGNQTSYIETDNYHVQISDKYTQQINRSPPEPKETQTVKYKVINEPLKELFKQVITPIHDHLMEDDHREVVIVPEGILYNVPFAALQNPQTGRYLCESHRIRIAPSLTTLKILKESSPDYHCGEGALVVGNPCVGEVMLRGEKKTFTNLPAAETEAKVISSVLNVSPLTGNYATKDAVKAQLKEDAAIIHIAAHGDSNTGEIALAPVISKESKPVPDEEDYILTMKEVQEIGVRAKLVVLSCCHSGRGEIRAEGVVGMARAFLAAGARAVVASLWAINDEATLHFMCEFYTHLKYGESASESLNESMKELIREKTYSHPKYWAPFVLIGDDVTIF